MSKEPHIEETLEKLTELVHSHQEALRCANEIISMKSRMIELCEQETAIYKRQAGKYGLSMVILSVMLVITSVLLLCNL
jgi:ABC-type Fe3+/spermidine/putrescine transport system ATPase subunit